MTNTASKVRKPFALGNTRRHAARGNALMEYAVPAAIILLTAGVLATLTDATSLMAEYYMSASGNTSASLSGTTFKTQGLAKDAFGTVSNGLSGFTNFGTLKKADGSAAGGTGGGIFYSGSYTRPGSRPESASPEYLFP